MIKMCMPTKEENQQAQGTRQLTFSQPLLQSQVPSCCKPTLCVLHLPTCSWYPYLLRDKVDFFRAASKSFQLYGHVIPACFLFFVFNQLKLGVTLSKSNPKTVHKLYLYTPAKNHQKSPSPTFSVCLFNNFLTMQNFQ